MCQTPRMATFGSSMFFGCLKTGKCSLKEQRYITVTIDKSFKLRLGADLHKMLRLIFQDEDSTSLANTLSRGGLKFTGAYVDRGRFVCSMRPKGRRLEMSLNPHFPEIHAGTSCGGPSIILYLTLKHTKSSSPIQKNPRRGALLIF